MKTVHVLYTKFLSCNHGMAHNFLIRYACFELHSMDIINSIAYMQYYTQIMTKCCYLYAECLFLSDTYLRLLPLKHPNEFASNVAGPVSQYINNIIRSSVSAIYTCTHILVYPQSKYATMITSMNEVTQLSVQILCVLPQDRHNKLLLQACIILL